MSHLYVFMTVQTETNHADTVNKPSVAGGETPGGTSSGMADWCGGLSSGSPPSQRVDQWIQRTCSTTGSAQTNVQTSAVVHPMFFNRYS